MSLQFSDVKFYQAFVNQSLLKLVHFSPSYSKHKRGGGVRHSVPIYLWRAVSECKQGAH